MNSKKGLIIGGDSHLGKALVLRLEKEGWEICSTTRRSELADKKVFFLDLLKPEISKWPKDFDAVWFLAAQTNQTVCKANPEQSYCINVKSPIQIMTVLSEMGTHVIFPSTSLVFAGYKSFQTVDDPIEPVGDYATQKSIVEKFLINSSINRKTILRMSKVLDKETVLLKQWIESFQQGKAIHPLSDLNFSPISLTMAVEVLAQIAIQKSYGIMQISSCEQCSYAGFSFLLANQLGFNTELIQPKTTSDLGLKDIYCPFYATLDSSLVERKFGISIPTIAKTIKEIFVGKPPA